MTSASLKKRRCETQKECHNFKQAARDICINNIFTLAIWDDKFRAEFKRLKGNDNTEDKYVETGNSSDLYNVTKEAYVKTNTKQVRNSCNKLSQSKVASKGKSDSFMKPCSHCGKGQKQG